jgi:hypothetical protein
MKKKLTTSQQRVRKAIAYLKNYMDTYDQQVGYLDYSDDTIIRDVLYGLGVALGGNKHRFFDGFARWRAVLQKHLAVENRCQARYQAADLTGAQLEGFDGESKRVIEAWRRHLLQAREKVGDFELNDVPRRGRWLSLKVRGKRAWKPEQGKVYLFKTEGSSVNPRSIMRAMTTKDGVTTYEVLWSVLTSPATHVWVEKSK